MTAMNWDKAKKRRPDPHDPLRTRPRLETWADKLLAAGGFQKPKPKKAKRRTKR